MLCKPFLAAFSEAQRRSFEKYERAETYRKYAIKRRDTKYISAALKEARPMIQIEQRVLDADEFLLNLPSGTCDLRTGAVREHNAQDYITKQTAVDPSGDGMDVWEDALQTFFQGDADLIRYVQEIVGLAAIGKVYIEALVIAYGEGRNGKSTFWNTIARVLGTYSGNMSADTLTVGCKRNVKPCSTPHVTEEQVKGAFVRAVNILISEKEELSANVRMVIAMLCDSAELEKRQSELKEELEVVVGLVERCVTENARIALDQDEYTERYNGLVSRYEAVKAQFDEVTQAVADKADRKKLLEQFLHTVETQEPITEFDERLWSSLVDFVTVYSEKGIRVTFKDGTEIQV